MIYHLTYIVAGGGNAMSLSELGRLAEPVLLIMASLAGGPKHGYAMMEDIEKMTGVHMGPGTLYGALVRMEEQGFIEGLPVVQRRRPYKLTSIGQQALRAQLTSMEQFASVGLQRLAIL